MDCREIVVYASIQLRIGGKGDLKLTPLYRFSNNREGLRVSMRSLRAVRRPVRLMRALINGESGAVLAMEASGAEGEILVKGRVGWCLD